LATIFAGIRYRTTSGIRIRVSTVVIIVTTAEAVTGVTLVVAGAMVMGVMDVITGVMVTGVTDVMPVTAARVMDAMAATVAAVARVKVLGGRTIVTDATVIGVV
jgi:hypothetical protein